MKINYNKPALTLIIIGIGLWVINALDVYLGYCYTHGKGFQILGIGLMVIGLVIWIKSR
ncbi:MAG TPA: hypothetical protein HA271_02055 [Methanobacterium subterraneum]|jgi:membrane-bound ClpP family serine protease|uniref:Uncharacterized protein n=1 Tax=Methanobacterium subterraneum TaxID=59277 RepID=A0A7J4TIC6_9EURY|nr:hypothetical protein [Methanobacterium subterraneum]